MARIQNYNAIDLFVMLRVTSAQLKAILNIKHVVLLLIFTDETNLIQCFYFLD